MDVSADRPEFSPPPEPALVRAFVLAVLAHLVLLFALMHGLHWTRETPDAVAEAELWSTLPQEAAPKPVPVQPAPPPPPPQPVVKAPPEPPAQKAPDINLERERQRRQLEEQRRQADLERQREDQRRKLEAQKKHDQELARQQQQQQKLAAQEQQRKLDEQKRKLEDQKRKLDEQKRKEQDAKLAQERERVRKEQLARMMAQAGSGSPDAKGNAQHSAGPSASWGALVQSRVRPNITFTDTISGNPEAEVEVRTSPDGTIVGKKLVHSSGVKSWDDAVLRALDKTETLPRDPRDGRVPSPVIIGFRPKG